MSLWSHGADEGQASDATAMAAGGAASVAECARAYERAKGYYTLITLPAEEVVRLAVDKPLRYSPAEWRALLAVRVPGRAASDNAGAALYRALDKAYNLSAGQKVAAALGELGNRVQVGWGHSVLSFCCFAGAPLTGPWALRRPLQILANSINMLDDSTLIGPCGHHRGQHQCWAQGRHAAGSRPAETGGGGHLGSCSAGWQVRAVSSSERWR